MSKQHKVVDQDHGRHAERAGYDVVSFARGADVSRGTIYALWSANDPAAPRSVKINTRRVITESPQCWLARLAQMQAAGSA